MLEIGAVLLRTETELILKSRRVVPQRLLERGFVFAYPHWPDAARDLCRAWLTRARRRRTHAHTSAAAATVHTGKRHFPLRSASRAPVDHHRGDDA